MGYKVTGIGFEGLDPVAIPMWRASGASVESNSTGVGKLQDAASQVVPAVAAFVRGDQVRPQLRIQLTRDGINDIGGQATITATAVNSDQPPLVANTQLQFDLQNRSQAIMLAWSVDLPNVVGIHKVTLQWTVKIGQGNVLVVGQTEVHLYIVNKAPVAVPGVVESHRMLAELAAWSCEFAAEKTNDVEIADAIFAQLNKTNIKYGPEGDADTIPQAISEGAAMCGLWGKLLQALFAWHGIEAPRRFFTFKLADVEPQRSESAWAAIVVKTFGMNRNGMPNYTKRPYYDYSGDYPIPSDPQIITTADIVRWRFWADRAQPSAGDGHQLVYLSDPQHNAVILYDPSFNFRNQYEGTIPTLDINPVYGEAILTFKQQYLDSQIAYFMENITILNARYEGVPSGKNGLTVLTQNIPAEKIGLIWMQG
ncbi:MAG: hypothetical protein ACKVZJ_14055 [Phycisphaerales bacterium]